MAGISILDLLFAKALAEGLARELTEDEQPPKNFFRVKDPDAWKRIEGINNRDNMVVCIEITNNVSENCQRVQSIFVKLAREFEDVQVPFFHVVIEGGETFDELRKGVGGVQYTPTILVVYYADSSKMIAKYEGGGEIMAAVQSDKIKQVIKQFVTKREGLRATKKLMGHMLMLRLLHSVGDDSDDDDSSKKEEMKEKAKEAQEAYDKKLEKRVSEWELEPPQRPSTAQNRFEIKFADLSFKSSDKIGQGAFGIVYKGKWMAQTVAIKKVMQVRKEEIAVLRALEHPNIIKMHGVSTDRSDNTYIVTEFADNGNLMDYIEKRLNKPERKKALEWAKQVAEAMKYLHQQDFAHRDLKTANVLLTSKWVAKICDFGASRDLSPSSLMTTLVGTLPWMAPEILEDKPFSKTCDVYSFGILLWELVTYQKPYTTNEKPFSFTRVVSGERPKLPSTASCPAHLQDLMQQCWNKDPKERPPFATIALVLR